MPFPFPLVPGSHADASIINNASDPSNMPLAGSHAIPQVSAAAALGEAGLEQTSQS